MKTAIATISWWITLLTGLLLVFIGLRFFLAPRLAELAFGIDVQTGDNFSFHFIKGGRDTAFGILTIVLLLTRQYKALGLMMLVVSIVPINDFLIVLNTPGHLTAKLYPHLSAILICLLMGPHFLIRARRISGTRQGNDFADSNGLKNEQFSPRAEFK